MTENNSLERTANSGLERIPVEVLGQVVSYLDLDSIQALSRANRPLNKFIDSHGWRSFIVSNFPSYKDRPLWKDAAHSLTRLRRAWDMRAMNARIILPSSDIAINHLKSSYIHQGDSDDTPSLRTNDHVNGLTNASPSTGRQRVGQTMGYHPVIDVVERWRGTKWTERCELMAVGAGSEVLFRTREIQKMPNLDQLNLNSSQYTYDDHRHRIRWQSWKKPELRDGQDDITALKLMDRSSESDAEKPLEMLVGRASGLLERVAFPDTPSAPGDAVDGLLSYDTAEQPVRFVDAMPSSSKYVSHFAAGLGAHNLALFSADSERPISSVVATSPDPRRAQVRLWATKFLSSNRLAAGKGISHNPLDVYAIRPEGIHPEPLRRYVFDDRNAAYAIESLPSSGSGVDDGDVFVSGMYDGCVMVHDLRAKLPVRVLYDNYDRNHSVYSLLAIQPHLILAGTSLHAKVCMFDLRKSSGIHDAENLYLSPKTQRFSKSSVYSLVHTGSLSPTLYAGLEGGVMQLDMFSATDKFPDPVFTSPSNKRKKERSARDKKYTPLSILRHIDENSMFYQPHMRHLSGALLNQRPFSHTMVPKGFKELDDRWEWNSNGQTNGWVNS